MTSRHTSLLAGIAIALLAASAVSAEAADLPAPADEQIAQISIRVIYAVKDPARSMDPSLEDIRGELEDLPFSKFRLLDKLESDVPLNSTVELQFPGNQSIAVRFRGIDVATGKRMLQLVLSIKSILKIEMRVTDGGRTLLLGPPHLEGALILDVSARLKGPSPIPAGQDKEKP
jgi:hypothetical protein